MNSSPVVTIRRQQSGAFETGACSCLILLISFWIVLGAVGCDTKKIPQTNPGQSAGGGQSASGETDGAVGNDSVGGAGGTAPQTTAGQQAWMPVSYTHLTLPTSDLV